MPMSIAYRSWIAALSIVSLLYVSGCATPASFDRSTVSQNVTSRFGHPVEESPVINQVIVPPGLKVGEPLLEDHAVLLALWNNPTFQELLTDLKLTKADLVQAGLLPNPEAVYYFSVADKPLKYLVDFPIEAIWLRPMRIKSAEAENARASERLTQSALDLIRDTRQAYADLVLAQERNRIAKEAKQLRARIASLADKRLAAGDASMQEVATAKIDSLLADQDVIRIEFEIPLAEERLKNIMGLASFSERIAVKPIPTERPSLSTEDLVREAVENRPDANAAILAVQAAEERLHLAKTSWFRFLGILDATSGRNTGHEFGPAIRLTLPIFNQNQGVIARAEAEREQLDRRRLTIHNQIITDVRLAATRYMQAEAEVESIRTKVRPEVESAIKRSEKAFQDGNTSYLLVLESTRQLIDAFFREAQLKTDRDRAWADLERSVGRKLAPAAKGSTP